MPENDKLNIPAFVIGLKSCPERWQPTIQKFSELGINARYWQAADGTDDHISLRSNEKLASPLRRWITGYKRLKTGEIGCYLSHYRLWQYAIRQNYDRVVIFEDDVIPLPVMRDLLIAVSALDKSYGMIHLGDSPNNYADFSEFIPQTLPGPPLPKGRKLLAATRRAQEIIGTHGYVVTRDILLKLVKRTMPMLLNLDTEVFSFSGIRTYVVMPTSVDLPYHFDPVSTGSNIITKKGEVHTCPRPSGFNRLNRIFWGLITYRHLFFWQHRKKIHEYLVDFTKYLFTQRFPLNPDGRD